MDLFKSINITTKIPRPKESLDVNKFLLKSSTEIKRYNNDLGSYMLLETQKSKIDHIHKNIWLNISFLSNPYEYIHPKITKYYKNDRIVSMEKPISRAFYKMWEIMNTFPIIKDKMNGRNILYHTEKPYLDTIKTAHLCEGPGGFIEALMKKRGHHDDEIHGITLMCENRNKLFNNITDYINIQYGNITNMETIEKFSNKFKKVKAYIVTADGGFEDEDREDIQEQIHSQLIFSEILTALKIQAQNGRFICKIYDINTKLTAFMIKLLTYFYKDVYIFKPTASRPINSERYLICLDFIGISDVILNKLIEIKNTWTEIDQTGGIGNNKNQKYVYSMYDDRNIEYKDISRFNFLYTNQQLKYINFALGSISNIHEPYFLDKIKQSQIDYSIEWCFDNIIPIHNKYKKGYNYIISCHSEKKKIPNSRTYLSYRSNDIGKHSHSEFVNNPSGGSWGLANSTYLEDSMIYKSILNAIDNNNEEQLKYILPLGWSTSMESGFKDKVTRSTRIGGKIQFFIYIYLSKKYHLLHYFIKNIRLSNLLYYLNAEQIVELLQNVSNEERIKIVLPMTKICLLYINKPENSILKEYFLKLYLKDIQQAIVKTPLNRLKYFIKFEKINILETLSKDYHLSIKIMRYSLYYNTSFPFIKKLHLINPHYNFTEDDLIRTITYGNFEMFDYIRKRTSFKLYNKYTSYQKDKKEVRLDPRSGASKYIFNYAIKYDYPIEIIKNIIDLYATSPNYNIYKLMKRDTEEIKEIFEYFNKKNFEHPNIKIYHFINDNYKTPNHLLLILYKYKVLIWSMQDLNFLKNKLSEKEMEELIKLISQHLYDDKLDLRTDLSHSSMVSIS